MHRALVSLHRVIGLVIAAFLFIAGFTGALIAWDHELDGLLNPELYDRPLHGEQALPPLQLAKQLEQRDPRLFVSYLPLSHEPDHALQLSVQPHPDPSTGKPYELGFDQVALDPTNGNIQGKREWGVFGLDRVHLMPFLYRLHYTLHLPTLSGVDLGMWVMGVCALAWVLDNFVALVIAFPNRRVWKRSLIFRLNQGGKKLTFDLHRSGGVWAWLLLLMISITAVSMNLEHEVMRPIVSLFSKLATDPFDEDANAARKPDPAATPIGREAALARAQQEAAARGITEPAGAIFHSNLAGVYGVGFFPAGEGHADGRLGNPWIYLDANSGKLMQARLPGEGSAGDVFLQAQFPLHSGRLFGFVGRVLISLLGIVIATLSVTGVLLWVRRKQRKKAA